MVTTRSADKRANENSKEEILALRSKLEESESSLQDATTEAVTPGSSRKQSKIVINVPPPRKRTRLSYENASGDDDDDDDIPSDMQGPQGIPPDVKNMSSEIPDSQDSPEKSNMTQQFDTQAELIEPEEAELKEDNEHHGKSKTIAFQNTISTKQLSRASKVLPPSTGKHNLYGSNEPSDDENSGDDSQSAVATAQSDAVENDDEEAPEVISTKRATSMRASRTKRRGKNDQSLIVVEEVTSAPATSNEALADVTNESAEGRETTPSAIISSLTIDTSLNGANPSLLESEDSNDTDFVTARTTRHVDAFSTPTDVTPQSQSPTHAFYDAVAQRPSAGTRQLNNDSIYTPISVRTPQTAISIPASSKLATSPVALPRKAGNTLENYRRQALQNRVVASARRSGSGRFKLQDEWSGKRRKFGTGY